MTVFWIPHIEARISRTHKDKGRKREEEKKKRGKNPIKHIH